jgi:glycosyltransferase involved in cell wall biosynthesis
MNLLTIYMKNKGGGFVKRFICMIEACTRREHTVDYLCRGELPIRSNFVHHHAIPPLGGKQILLAMYLLVVAPIRLMIVAGRKETDVLVVFGFFYGFLMIPARLLMKRPLVIFVRGDWIGELQRKQTFGLVILAARLIRFWAFRAADSVVVNSNSLSKIIGLTCNDKQRERIIVITNHVEPIAPDQRLHLQRSCPVDLQKLRPAGQAFIIGYAGGLNANKDVALLIRAFARLQAKRNVLVLVGSGPDEARLKALAEELNVADRVYFAGQQPDALSFTANFNLLVLPSHGEGCPNVVLEAMACGIPAIGSAVPGVLDVLRNKELLYPPGDEDALYNKLELLSGSPEDLNIIAQTCRVCREPFLFDWDKAVVDHLLRVELAARPGA